MGAGFSVLYSVTHNNSASEDSYVSINANSDMDSKLHSHINPSHSDFSRTSSRTSASGPISSKPGSTHFMMAILTRLRTSLHQHIDRVVESSSIHTTINFFGYDIIYNNGEPASERCTKLGVVNLNWYKCRSHLTNRTFCPN